MIANNAQIYQGGAQVLQNIRGVRRHRDVLGRDPPLLQRASRTATATSDDLRRAMEEACKNAGGRCPAEGRDLTWLFRELLNRGGVLQVQGSWQYDEAAKQVQVTLDQGQASGLYRMPIEVAISAMAEPEPDAMPAGRGGRGGAPPQAQPVQRIDVDDNSTSSTRYSRSRSTASH